MKIILSGGEYMKKVKGFTLIEMIIVLAIIGILGGILIPSWMNYIANSKIKKQNENAKIIFNAAQTAAQDYKFYERKLKADEKILGDGDFYFYCEHGDGDVSDNAGNIITLSTNQLKASPNFNDDFAEKINKIFSDSDETVYFIHINNYMVESVVSGRSDNDLYLGSYPDKQTERNGGTNTVFSLIK